MYSESDWRGLLGCLISIGIAIGAVVMLLAQWTCAHVRVTW